MAMDMDIELGAPCLGRSRTPDSDTHTPPRNPPTKRHNHHNNTYAPGVSYKECMKNHAASIGSHARDGCCEFMQGPTSTPLHPTSLKCAACGCHRNFHRREPDDPTPLNHHLTLARTAHSLPSATQVLLSLSHSPSDEVNPNPTPVDVGSGSGVLVRYIPGGGQNGNFTSGSSSTCKKRFRTKFTAEQKEKMYEFSEKIGWKLRKGEDKVVEEFLNEIGVGRSVFKVWMHNNKHNSSSTKTTNTTDQQQQQQTVDVVVPSTNPTTHSYAAQQERQQQHHGMSNGNCGASVVVDNQHNHHHHRRQFSFANGGGQEATQAQ